MSDPLNKDDGYIAKVEKEIDEYKANVSKFFESGNKAAGTRARKALSNITKLGKGLRKKIQEVKNESKNKIIDTVNKI